jgi:purine-binding chemotaxis protein CheW
MAFEGDDSQTDAYLLCRAGRHLCALPMRQTIETMRILAIETLSGAPDFVRGLSVIRGTAVPVIDLPRLLNAGETKIIETGTGETGTVETQAQRLVTINIGDRVVALLVDRVLSVRSIAASSVSALPPLMREAASEAVSAIGILDTELLFFLNNLRILSESILNAPQAAGAPL